MAGAVVMLGGADDSPAGRLVWRARAAGAVDSVNALIGLGVRPVVVASPSFEWLPPGLSVVCEPDGPGAFHFGQSLSALLAGYRLDRVIYLGGGSIPLLTREHLAGLLALLDGAGESPLVVTNNLHSADWFGLNRAELMVGTIAGADRDNAVPWLLREAGFVVKDRVFPPQLDLDIDTPTDLALASLHGGVGPEMRKVIQDERDLLGRVPTDRIAKVLGAYGSQIALFGRVPPGAWDALSRATSVWIRVYSEERGMVASGRVARGEVISLPGVLMDEIGPSGFFELLAGMVDAAIIDSRVLMAHRRIWPVPGDRFASDLLMPDWVSEPWLRRFTDAAAEASIPVLLGGHNVVSVGLYILASKVGRLNGS